MRTSSTWLRWLAVLLVLLTSVIGSYATSTCHCGHEDAASHEPDACADDCAGPCDGVCACHLTIVPWQPPVVLGHAALLIHDLPAGFTRTGDLHARLIYSPPRS